MLKKWFAKKSTSSKVLDELRLTAKAGDKAAQYKLGVLYETGDQGVPRNLTLAYRWYHAASEQGHVDAMHRLTLLQSIIRADTFEGNA